MASAIMIHKLLSVPHQIHFANDISRTSFPVFLRPMIIIITPPITFHRHYYIHINLIAMISGSSLTRGWKSLAWRKMKPRCRARRTMFYHCRKLFIYHQVIALRNNFSKQRQPVREGYRHTLKDSARPSVVTFFSFGGGIKDTNAHLC